jgi:phosphate transport system protein
VLRTHYINELESVRRNLVEMGETTIALFNEAQRSIADPSPSRSATAAELEAKTDLQHRDIHDQCLGLITLQAPVAGDARLVTGILDAIVDLELVGDYSHEIVGFCLAIQRRLPSQVLSQAEAIASKVGAILGTAIDSWRNGDRAQALSVRSQEAAIRAECESMYEKLSQLVSGPGDAAGYVDLMLVCKHLQRIVRHSVCVAGDAAEAAPATFNSPAGAR